MYSGIGRLISRTSHKQESMELVVRERHEPLLRALPDCLINSCVPRAVTCGYQYPSLVIPRKTLLASSLNRAPSLFVNQKSFSSKATGESDENQLERIEPITNPDYLEFTDDDEAITYLSECEHLATIQQQQEGTKGIPEELRNTNLLDSILLKLAFGSKDFTFENISIAQPMLQLFSANNVEHNESINTVTVSFRGERPTMEDAHIASHFQITLGKEDYSIILTAVLDGHGGSECANFTARHLQSHIEKSLIQYNKQSLSTRGIVNALSKAVLELSHNYNNRAIPKEEYNLEAGTTLNLSLEIDGEIFFANVGDSRAVYISDTGFVKQLTADHNLCDSQQVEQVKSRGGEVIKVQGVPRVNGRLAVPAALGNHWSNGVISATPRISRFRRQDLKDGVILQACDGIFEVVTTAQLGDRVAKNLEQGVSLINIAKDTILASWECGSTDNMSILIRRVD